MMSCLWLAQEKNDIKKLTIGWKTYVLRQSRIAGEIESVAGLKELGYQGNKTKNAYPIPN